MTTSGGPDTQPESLSSVLDRIYQALIGAARGPAPDTPGSPRASPPVHSDEPCHALERLRTLFGLSSFEKDLLVLCAGPSLQSRFTSGCAAALNDGCAAYPTFGLALTVLDDPHWSAISPARPLRYWRLLDTDGGNLLHGPLRIDERIFHFLIGVPAFDERLQALARPILASSLRPGSDGIGPASAVRAGAGHWERPVAAREPLLLIGRHRSTREDAFAAICERSGLRPYVLDASDIPAAAPERDQLARLWTREAALAGAALYLRTENCDGIQNLSAWLELTDAPVAVEVPPGTAAERLDGVRLHLAAMSAGERKRAWARELGALAGQMDGCLDRIAEYFYFDEPAIRLSAAAIRETAASEDTDPGELGWRICREQARHSLETLAQRVDARACWADLVLPAAQVETLRQIAVHLRQRATVNERWGFAAKHSRGIGLTALFAGDSGTGKTMAAEILAAELDLDLYKVDLASVVSKYIGETEKNLRAIFSAAEESGAILLFDEADALFGKRSEVRDSHDRYANLEISYLLQQMESYRGVAILTTNMRHAIDPAFMRRIRFIVQFPFPDAAARSRIWQRIFPDATPVAELDFDRLAQMNVAGGVIRNIAMLAAFLAADDSMVVEARHILAAARTEYAKIDKPLTAAETRGLA
jgi:ATPase family associated with various cellular activities (AAA)/Winged helix domain, variant